MNNSENTLDVLLWITKDSKKRRLVEFLTGESWTHVGIVISGKHLQEMHNTFDFTIDPNILYIWESGYNGVKDAEDNKIKRGVMITPWKRKMNQLKNDNGRCALRRFNRPITKEIINKLNEAHTESYNKKYDINPLHFLEALFGSNLGLNGQYDRAFFCSAFVAYIFTKIGCLEPSTQWTTIQPKYFASNKVDHFLDPIDESKSIRKGFWEL